MKKIILVALAFIALSVASCNTGNQKGNVIENDSINIEDTLTLDSITVDSIEVQ